MGELIICSENTAGVPYFLEDISLNVYSLEELSYYILNQAYMLDVTFANLDLVNWIRQELDMKELSDLLEDDLNNHSPLHIFIDDILNACGYLTKAEIKNIIEVIAGFENKSEAEVGKMRSDRLFENGRIVEAIYAYEQVLNKDISISSELKGNIYHNLGCSYARLFFYEQAIECFESAYRQNRNPSSLSALLHACRLDDNNELYEQIALRYQVFPEQLVAVDESIKAFDGDSRINDFKSDIIEARKKYQDPDAYRKYLDSIVNEWKSDYNLLCKF